MRVRRTKMLLWSATIALAAAAVLSLGLGLLLPCRTPPPAHTAIAPANSHAGQAAWAPTLADFERLGDIDLRRPLTDVPTTGRATIEQPAVPVPDTFQLKLAGTVIESGHSYALLITGDGRLQLKAIGELADGAEVLDIQDDNVTLRFKGEPVVLRIPKPG